MMRNLLCLCVFLLCVGPAHASDWPAQRQKILDVISPVVEQGCIPGLAIGVIDGERTEYITLGEARPGKKVTKRTLFPIASVSKTYTALALAVLAERNIVSLDTPANDLLPDDVQLPGAKGAPITLAHLASHTSGLQRMPDNIFDNADMENPYAHYDVDELKAYLPKAKLLSFPGSKYEYSNLGSGILGYALAQRTGSKNYEALVRKIVLRPLGLNNTMQKVSWLKQKYMAQGHDPVRGKTPAWDWDVLSGAGALKADVRDLVKYARSYLMRDELGNHFQRAMHATLQPRHKMNSIPVIGLAWHFANNGYAWHGGGSYGFGSHVIFHLEDQRAIVVMGNMAVPIYGAIGNSVLQALLGAEPYPLTHEAYHPGGARYFPETSACHWL